MSKFKNPEVGQIVYLKQNIFEPPCEDHPGWKLGDRGDAVIVTYVNEKSNSYTVTHPQDKDNDNSGYRVYHHEIMLTDPLVTILEQRAYMKRKRYTSLEQRYYRKVYNNG